MRSPVSPLITITAALCLVACDETEEPAAHSAPPAIQQLDTLSTDQRRVFLKGFPGDWRADTAMARGEPEPPAALPIPPDATIISLPAPGTAVMPLGQAIRQRRSQREFTDAPLTIAQLSLLLASTQGVTRTERADPGGITHQFRAAPSAGARYPLETFLAVQRVDGLDPGLYRYLPPAHQLLLVREDPAIGSALQHACYDNATAGTAAATFIWAAVPERSEWKYGCIAHKMIAIEAGHVGQNLYLATEAIGAGTCAILGYHQPALDALLNVDGSAVLALYLAPVGIPASNP